MQPEAWMSPPVSCLHSLARGSLLPSSADSMAVFGKVFGPESCLENAGVPVRQHAVRQPRSVAQNLCLASCLMPLMASDITADYLPEIFASDLSLGRGAYCGAKVSPSVAKTAWLNGD